MERSSAASRECWVARSSAPGRPFGARRRARWKSSKSFSRGSPAFPALRAASNNWKQDWKGSDVAEVRHWRVILVGGHTRSIGKTQLVCDIVRAFPQTSWIAGKITQYGHGVCARNGHD